MASHLVPDQHAWHCLQILIIGITDSSAVSLQVMKGLTTLVFSPSQAQKVRQGWLFPPQQEAWCWAATPWRESCCSEVLAQRLFPAIIQTSQTTLRLAGNSSVGKGKVSSFSKLYSRKSIPWDYIGGLCRPDILSWAKLLPVIGWSFVWPFLGIWNRSSRIPRLTILSSTNSFIRKFLTPDCGRWSPSAALKLASWRYIQFGKFCV